MKFANGAVGVLDINWLTPTKRRTLTVTGERGMYVADYIDQDLVFYRQPATASRHVENRGRGWIVAAPITSVAEGEMTRPLDPTQEPLARASWPSSRVPVREQRPAAGRPARRDDRPAARPQDGRGGRERRGHRPAPRSQEALA